jgi:hypothetical protein
MLRGKIVVEGGTFTGDLRDGQFLPRKVPDEIRARPVVQAYAAVQERSA